MKKAHSIQLASFRHDDYDRLISWVDTPETLMQFAGPAFTYPLTREQLDKSISDINRHAFALVDSTCNDTIGHAEIYLTEGGAYLGRILIGDKLLRGKGIGQQIVTDLLDYAFMKLHQQSVQLNVFDWNTPAIKCYEKAGFTIVPGKTAQREVNGQSWTVLRMVIGRGKWEQQKVMSRVNPG